MTTSIEDLVVRQSPGVLHVVLTTSDEDLVALQSPEASSLRRFDDLGQRGFVWCAKSRGEDEGVRSR